MKGVWELSRVQTEPKEFRAEDNNTPQIMPNSRQWVYLSSFALTLAFLVSVSQVITSKLREAGYPISHLILIGLDKEDSKSQRSSMSSLATPALLFSASLVLFAIIYNKFLRSARATPLDSNKWKEFPLEKKYQVSPNTAIYRFKLPHRDDILGLPIGQHISVSAEINGKNIIRNYTPISLEDDRGYFELIIKTYEKGNISKHVSLLKLGQSIRVKGPKGNFLYTPNLVRHITMIAGGTGIAPMVQIIRACLRNPSDHSKITLIYANVTSEDILLKSDLEELQKNHGLDKFKIHYVLNNPPPNWTGGVGFVTKEHIREHIPNPDTTDSKLLICGPPPMVAAMKKNLEDLAYPIPNTISKLHDKVFVF